MSFEHPIATVDAALFTVQAGALCVLLCRRDQEPYAGTWALPGGFVHVDEDEDTAATARRVIERKTHATVGYMEQLYTFSGRARDPRGWSISVTYFALIPAHQIGADVDPDMRIVAVSALPALPFDHNRIVDAAVIRLRNKSAYSSLPTYLLPSEFTLAELRTVYTQVMGSELDRTSFRRNMLEQGVIEAIAGQKRGGAHRPAQLYRRNDSELMEFDRVL